MKISVRHQFGCSPQHFWATFWDPAFDEHVQAASPVKRELLETRAEGQVRIQRFRFTSDQPLPGPVAAAAGTDRLTYEQVNRYDEAQGVLHWEVIPMVLKDKISAKGKLWASAHPKGCERIVEGDIDVKIFLIGSKVEQAIVDTVSRSYDQAAKLTEAWFTRHPPT